MEAIAARPADPDERLFSNHVIRRLHADLDETETLEMVAGLALGPLEEREFAAQLLIEGPVSSGSVVGAVNEILSNESEPTVLSLLVDALGYARTPSALPTLHRLASHRSADVRFTVPMALSQCSDGDFNSIAEPLLALSADSLAEVRWSAVYELCEWCRDTGDERIVDRLRRLQDSNDACFHVYGPMDVPPL